VHEVMFALSVSSVKVVRHKNPDLACGKQKWGRSGLAQRLVSAIAIFQQKQLRAGKFLQKRLNEVIIATRKKLDLYYPLPT
jgi:hypothetical protein